MLAGHNKKTFFYCCALFFCFLASLLKGKESIYQNKNEKKLKPCFVEKEKKMFLHI